MHRCGFCHRESLDVLMENDPAFAVRDKFPVRPLHTLVLPKRHLADTFDLTPEELRDLFDLARRVRDALRAADPSIDGDNFGTNNGAVAGSSRRWRHAESSMNDRNGDDVEGPQVGVTARGTSACPDCGPTPQSSCSGAGFRRQTRRMRDGGCQPVLECASGVGRAIR